ncbi:MAG: hypothetical protein JNN23_06275 [Chryseobacterium gambrini]|nr:hypothetical protein [Chryseobacterium gambrini]
MAKFRKRLKIENAEKFKLEYITGKAERTEREFETYKAMEQFHSRQNAYMYLDGHRYAFINGKWHRFIKLLSPIVFERDIEFIKKTFYENIEVENLRISENED